MKVYCIRHHGECIKKLDGYWYCPENFCGIIEITLRGKKK